MQAAGTKWRPVGARGEHYIADTRDERFAGSGVGHPELPVSHRSLDPTPLAPSRDTRIELTAQFARGGPAASFLGDDCLAPASSNRLRLISIETMRGRVVVSGFDASPHPRKGRRASGEPSRRDGL